MNEALRDLILTLPGVVEGKSRFSDRLAYTVGRKEFVHFHSATEVDIRLPRKHQRTLPPPLDAIARPKPTSDWIPMPLGGPDDVETAFRLIQAAYRTLV